MLLVGGAVQRELPCSVSAGPAAESAAQPMQSLREPSGRLALFAVPNCAAAAIGPAAFSHGRLQAADRLAMSGGPSTAALRAVAELVAAASGRTTVDQLGCISMQSRRIRQVG